MAELNLEGIVKNNDIVIEFTVDDVDGNLVDLTGYTILWQVRKTYGSTVLISKTNGSGVTITDAANGKFTVAIEKADTADMAPGAYRHEALTTDENGFDVTIIDPEKAIAGTFQLRDQLAKP